jgi:hypothetical protein
MMNAGYDDEFAPNPFRSNSNETDLLGAANPPPMQQQQPDPYSGMTGTLDPTPPPQPPQQQQQPTATDPSLWSGAMDQRGAPVESYGGGNGNAPGAAEIASTPFSVLSWRSWVACFQIQAYQPYFDVDTVNVTERLKASLLQFYQPDQFRTAVVGDFPTETLKGPDLYGPLWIMMTLVFVLAATSNVYFFWEHRKDKRAADDETTVEEFQVDIHHLVHASNVVLFFVLGVASAFWLCASCLGMPGISWGLWVCLYGYAQMPIMVAAFFIALIPIRLVTLILLGSSVGASALLILRNLSTPLLSQDVSGRLTLFILFSHTLSSHALVCVCVFDAATSILTPPFCCSIDGRGKCQGGSLDHGHSCGTLLLLYCLEVYLLWALAVTHTHTHLHPPPRSCQ